MQLFQNIYKYIFSMRLLHLFIILLILVTTNTLAQNFKRIISLSPAATFNLMELGSVDKIVGCTKFCELGENEDLVVASAISMNIERVIALKPDLVIYTTMFKPNQIERLTQFGIRTELFKSPKDWKETCDQFIRLGELVSQKKKAEHYIDSLEQLMNKVTQSIPKNEKQKIFMEIGAKPLFTAVPNTFMHDYIVVLGGVNIANDQTSGTISRERVLMKNPDIIILVTMGTVSKSEKQVWESYTDLNATKNNKIITIDADLACQPTPYNFLNTIIELNKLLYGK